MSPVASDSDANAYLTAQLRAARPDLVLQVERIRWTDPTKRSVDVDLLVTREAGASRCSVIVTLSTINSALVHSCLTTPMLDEIVAAFPFDQVR